MSVSPGPAILASATENYLIVEPRSRVGLRSISSSRCPLWVKNRRRRREDDQHDKSLSEYGQSKVSKTLAGSPKSQSTETRIPKRSSTVFLTPFQLDSCSGVASLRKTILRSPLPSATSSSPMMCSVFIQIFGAFFERASLAITSRLAFAFARELCCDVAPLVFLMLPRVVRRCCLPIGLSLSVTSFAISSRLFSTRP